MTTLKRNRLTEGNERNGPIILGWNCNYFEFSKKMMRCLIGVMEDAFFTGGVFIFFLSLVLKEKYDQGFQKINLWKK